MAREPAGASAATRGQSLMQAKGCFACHSLDGSPRTGPSFEAMAGLDDAHIARALRDPDAEAPAGYKPGTMPKFDVSDEEANAIAAAIHHPDAIDPAVAGRGGSIVPLAGSALGFVFLHFALSSIPVRTQVEAAIGKKGFRAVYSILAFATFIGMIVFYRTAPFSVLWDPPRWTRWIPVLTMPLALFFIVAGFTSPNPTAVEQEDKVKDERPRGIVAVTRHPALWGFTLWAAAHLATNGELHVVIVASAILVLAVGGMLHIDARRRATLGADWDAFAAKTSVIPFAAIAGKRAVLVPSEIGAKPVVIAAIVYVAIFFAHPYVIGASPSP